MLLISIPLAFIGCASDRDSIFEDVGYIKHRTSPEEQTARQLREEARRLEVAEYRSERKAEIDARFLEREKGGSGTPVIELMNVDELLEKLALEPDSDQEEPVRIALEGYVEKRTEIMDSYKEEEEKPEFDELKGEVQDLVEQTTDELDPVLDGREMKELQWLLGTQIMAIKDEIYGGEDELRPGQGIYGKLVDDPKKGGGSSMGGMGGMMGKMKGGGGGRGRR